MRFTIHTLAAAANVAALLAVFHAAPALAGAAEDYAEGAKHYNAGDIVAAMPLLRRAADAGHPAAQATLGTILDHADSDTEALEYFRKAAAQGNADGALGLGNMLVAGEGVARNVPEGRKWIEQAASQGHVMAINVLAQAYISGGLDMPDAERQGAAALRWITVAADNGYLAAMEKLAAAYRNGELGLDVDTKTAKQWEDKIEKLRGPRQTRRKPRSN